jgi:hypothetical protein
VFIVEELQSQINALTAEKAAPKAKVVASKE